MRLTTILVCFITILAAEPLLAQGSLESESANRGASIGIWYAYSPSSNSFFAKMKRARFTLAGVDITYANLKAGNLVLYFSSQFIAYSRTDFPANGRTGPRNNRSGIGVTPIRITVPFGNKRNSYPYISTGGGLMLFKKRFPNDGGTRLNVTVDLGIGYNISIDENYSIDFGYRFHHLSNGDTGEVNPGLDSNLFIATLQLKIPRN